MKSGMETMGIYLDTLIFLREKNSLEEKKCLEAGN